MRNNFIKEIIDDLDISPSILWNDYLDSSTKQKLFNTPLILLFGFVIIPFVITIFIITCVIIRPLIVTLLWVIENSVEEKYISWWNIYKYPLGI